MMKNYRNRSFPAHSQSENQDLELYSIYLQNKLFRGFYYDSDERSYGIVLSYAQPGIIELYAQESKAGNTLIEYRLASDNFHIEQIAYDKVAVKAWIQSKRIITPKDMNLEFPKTVEFTTQILTRNSIYIRFLNHELFAPPISSFRAGLILSKDYNPLSHKTTDIEVEAGDIS